MAKESLEPLALEKVGVSSLRRHSTGKPNSSISREHAPHYLRASTGSCHDLCKYGKHIAEEGQALAERKKNRPTLAKSKPKPKPLPNAASITRSRTGLPDVNEIHKSRIRAIKHEVPSSDRARPPEKSTPKAAASNTKVGMKATYVTSARPLPGRVATSKPTKPRIPKTVPPPPDNENATKKSEVKQQNNLDEAQEKILYVIAVETQSPPSESDQHQYGNYGEEDSREQSDNDISKKASNTYSEETIEQSLKENRRINADGGRRSYKARQVEEETKGGSEQVVLRHQDVEEKKDGEGLLLNKVIEEAASKLGGTQKSKVKALVGAFETVISLQDRKPYATTVN